MRARTALLLTVPAIAMLCFLALPAAAEPDNNASTANPITPGLWGPYNITAGGDVDYYVFTLNATAFVRLELNGSGGEDSYMCLYDVNVSYITCDDDSGVGLWSRIIQTLDAGTYYVMVQHLNLYSTIAEYYLTFAAESAPDLPLGLSGPYDIDSAGDVDYYTITAAGPTSIRLETNGTTGDASLILYTSGMSVWASDHRGNAPYSRILTLITAGTYYLYVYNYSGGGASLGYTLLYEAASPTPITEGANGPFSWSYGALQPWFVMNFSNQTTLHFQLNVSAGYPSMTLYDSYLYYENGASGYNSSTLHMYDTVYAGLHYLRVLPNYGTTPFTFTIDLQTAGPDGFDGNGQMSSATALALGLNGPFDLVPQGDVDWYWITFTGDGIAEFQLQNLGYYSLATLYDENGSYLGQSSYGGSPYVSDTVTAATYYLRVYDSYSGYDIYGYTIDVAFTQAPPPDNNDNPASATAIGTGQSGPFVLYGNDVDWYVFAAPSPGTLTVETSGPRGGATIDLYDDQQNWIAGGSSSYNYSFQILTQRVDTGTYYIMVDLPYSLAATPEYNITITFVAYTSPDGNDFKSQAQVLVPGPNGPFSISDYQDVDWYFFDVADAGDGSIDLVSGTGGAQLTLYNSTGAQLAQTYYYYGSSISWTFTTGRYYLKAAYSSYFGTGSYNVTLDLPDLTPPAILISSPTNGSTVSAWAVAIRGTTEVGASLLVNGQPVYVDGSGHFTATVLVPVGAIDITIVARDYKLNTVTLTWVLVGEAPSTQNDQRLADLADQLAALQAQLANTSAALNATNAAQSQSNNDNKASQDAAVVAAQQDASAQRGLAYGALAIAGLAAVAAIALAALMMRKRPPMEGASAPAPPPAAWPPQQPPQ